MNPGGLNFQAPILRYLEKNELLCIHVQLRDTHSLQQDLHIYKLMLV